MIYLNLSYFDTIVGPQTFCTIPNLPEVNIEEYTNTLLNISEYIDLKFFVYVSSPHFKTSNIYTKIPSEWARGKLEMLLISIILVNEDFNRLFVFEEILERIMNEINKIDNAYMAFYSQNRQKGDINSINAKKDEILKLLQKFLPEIEKIIITAKQIPIDSEVIETEENLQDEFVILHKDESVFEASKKLAARSRILLGCILEEKRPIGVLDEDDILNKVILKGRDPLIVKVGEIMTKTVITVDANAPIDGIIELMIEKGIQAVPILQDNEFFGVFTIFDAASHNKNIIDIIGEQIKDISPKKLDDVKNIEVKFWNYIRNIIRNRKFYEKQKEQST